MVTDNNHVHDNIGGGESSNKDYNNNKWDFVTVMSSIFSNTNETNNNNKDVKSIFCFEAVVEIFDNEEDAVWPPPDNKQSMPTTNHFHQIEEEAKVETNKNNNIDSSIIETPPSTITEDFKLVEDEKQIESALINNNINDVFLPPLSSSSKLLDSKKKKRSRHVRSNYVVFNHDDYNIHNESGKKQNPDSDDILALFVTEANATSIAPEGHNKLNLNNDIPCFDQLSTDLLVMPDSNNVIDDTIVETTTASKGNEGTNSRKRHTRSNVVVFHDVSQQLIADPKEAPAPARITTVMDNEKDTAEPPISNPDELFASFGGLPPISNPDELFASFGGLPNMSQHSSIANESDKVAEEVQSSTTTESPFKSYDDTYLEPEIKVDSVTDFRKAMMAGLSDMGYDEVSRSNSTHSSNSNNSSNSSCGPLPDFVSNCHHLSTIKEDNQNADETETGTETETETEPEPKPETETETETNNDIMISSEEVAQSTTMENHLPKPSSYASTCKKSDNALFVSKKKSNPGLAKHSVKQMRVPKVKKKTPASSFSKLDGDILLTQEEQKQHREDIMPGTGTDGTSTGTGITTHHAENSLMFSVVHDDESTAKLESDCHETNNKEEQLLPPRSDLEIESDKREKFSQIKNDATKDKERNQPLPNDNDASDYNGLSDGGDDDDAIYNFCSTTGTSLKSKERDYYIPYNIVSDFKNTRKRILASFFLGKEMTSFTDYFCHCY